MMTMNRSTHIHRSLWRLFSGLLALLAFTGCQDRVYTGDVECPPTAGKQIVRITTRVLDPANSTRAANDFRPEEKSANAFESQIATLRVMGFYADGANVGKIAFNQVFADKQLINRIGWNVNPGVASLNNNPSDAPGTVSVEFETDITGKINVVLLANGSLKAVAKPSAEQYNEDALLYELKKGSNGAEAERTDLQNIQSVDDLRSRFMGSPFYFIFDQLADPNADPDNTATHLAHYQGAVPGTLWKASNGGLPMVGQGEITIVYNGPSSTGSDPVTGTTINLERLLAKLEVTITNVSNGEVNPNTWGLRLRSIKLNNHPMYAMLLPAKRADADKDYTSPSATHHYYSDPVGNRYMDMYRAEEKTLTAANGQKVIPLDPKGYDPGSTVDDGILTNFKPAYNLFYYYTVHSNDRFTKVDWRYFTRPYTALYDGKVAFYNFTAGAYRQLSIQEGYSMRPLALYMLPTTNEKMPVLPSDGKISPKNGIADMDHEPTEVIVTTALYGLQDYPQYVPRDRPDWTYYPAYDRYIEQFRFILENKDTSKTNDKYAIRRNTIYRVNLVWEGKEVYRIDDGIKVLPWRKVKQDITIDPDDPGNADPLWPQS